MTLLAFASGPLTVSAIIGTVIAALLVVLCLGVAAAALITRPKHGYGYSRSEYTVTAAVAGVLSVLVVIGYVLGMWPFAYEYHHWIPTNGTVESVSKRITSDGDGNINEKFVLRFTDGRIRAVNDTAAGILREGDPVTLRCKKSYEFSTPRSAHGWDCKWAGRRL